MQNIEKDREGNKKHCVFVFTVSAFLKAGEAEELQALRG